MCSEVLRVVETRDPGEGRQAEQHFRQGVPGCAEETEKAARLLITKGILLEPAQVETRSKEVRTSDPCRGIGDLVASGCAVLRVVGFIAQRRVAQNGNLAEAEVA